MKPPYAIGSVPSLSGHAIAYRWRSLPRVRRHRASKAIKVVPNECYAWQVVTMDQLICASPSHTHYWYEVGMLKVPAGTDSSFRFASTARSRREQTVLLIHFSAVQYRCLVFRDGITFNPSSKDHRLSHQNRRCHSQQLACVRSLQRRASRPTTSSWLSM